MQQSTKISFILNWLDFEPKLPIDITKEIQIRKAKEVEVKLIKEKMESLNESMRFDIYEKQGKKTEAGTRFLSLPLEEWRYYVFEFARNIDINDNDYTTLNLALALMEPTIQMGVHFISKRYTTESFHNDIVSKLFLNSDYNSNPTIVTNDHIKEIKTNIYLIKRLQSEHPDLYRIISEIEGAKTISHRSKFKILAFFTILEQLLTHKPKDVLNLDSLTRQISNKIPLINNRINNKIEYERWFGNYNQVTILKKLYTYRSNVAHGVETNFKKDFHQFKNYYHITEFVEHLTKKIMKAALVEPQLIADLKNC